MTTSENGTIESRLQQLGLELPQPLRVPAGLTLPFSWVRIADHRAVLSGHLPTDLDGSLAQPLGKVGAEVSLEQAAALAKRIALAMLGTLMRELGSLDRVSRWLRVFGMVNGAPGFTQTAQVINGFSETIVEIFGPEIGLHARAAVGMAELPFNAAVEIEAEVEIAD